MVQRSPPKNKNKITAAFQSGGFSSFPPGSNCLFSSVVVLCLGFAGVEAVPARIPTCSVGEEMSANVVDPMPTSKKPSAMVCPFSHVSSFGGHCCPGVSRPVPADSDWRSFSSRSILPSLFFNLTHTSGEGSGVWGLGLQYCTVSTGYLLEF